MPAINLKTLLEEMVSRRGSDLHLTVGSPPQMRVDGDLMALGSYERLGPEETQVPKSRRRSSRRPWSLTSPSA
jgi:twitching motility protein PilT